MVMAFVRQLALGLLGLLFVFSLGNPGTDAQNKICNNISYGSDDPYAKSVSYVIEDMADSTANSYGYDYYTQSPGSEATAFGHAVCSTEISNDECAICLYSAKVQIIAGCPNRIGAQMLLQDCRMRYENYPFSD